MDREGAVLSRAWGINFAVLRRFEVDAQHRKRPTFALDIPTAHYCSGQDTGRKTVHSRLLLYADPWRGTERAGRAVERAAEVAGGDFHKYSQGFR